MSLGTYLEDKIWVQVSQNGSLVATSFQLMIFHARWFSCQEGVEFRGSAASKTSEHPMFKAFNLMQETDLWWIHDINTDRIGFLDPCWSSTKAATSRAWGPCRIIESQLNTTMNIVYECYIDVFPFGQGWFPASYGCLLDCNTRCSLLTLPRWKCTRHGT